MVIQVCVATLDNDDEVHKEFYEKLQKTMDKIPHSGCVFIMSGFNTIFNCTKEPCITGRYGTAIQNVCEPRLIDLCSANQMFITNTKFQHHARIKITWISPGERTRNEIDYIIIVRDRYQTSASNC